MTDFKVGDRVRVVREFTEDTDGVELDRIVGRTGTLTKVDPTGEGPYRYRIMLDDTSGLDQGDLNSDGSILVEEVEAESGADSASCERQSCPVCAPDSLTVVVISPKRFTQLVELVKEFGAHATHQLVDAACHQAGIGPIK
jgi:hypothetical protein